VVASTHPFLEASSTVAAVLLVAEAVQGCRCPVSCVVGMDQGFPHVSGGRDVVLRGASPPSGGGALGLLDCGIFQEALEFALDTPPSVVDGSGIVRSNIAAAARFWPAPLNVGGGPALASSII
jgi:hypothetical protein